MAAELAMEAELEDGEEDEKMVRCRAILLASLLLKLFASCMSS